MASQDARERATLGSSLRLDSDGGPLDADATRISWALGDRILSRDDPDPAFDCEQAGSAARVTAFEATDATYLVRVRTPVGRERYYEVPADSFDAYVDTFSTASGWQVVRHE